MGQLEGKVAVITGSTRGFGLAMARAYAREGAAVVVSSSSSESVMATVAQLESEGAWVSGLQCDVADLDGVESLKDHALDAFGQIDIWVNNAGVSGPTGPTALIPPDQFLRVLQTNIFGVYHGSLVALRYFVPRAEGKLINLLGQGDRRPQPLVSAYSSSKAWVNSFTGVLAKEYEDSGVGVFALNPSLMYTELMLQVDAISGYEDQLKVLETIMRMWANDPAVPAAKAVWLAGPATDGRTGLTVRVMTPVSMLRGALREGVRRLLRRPAPPDRLNIRVVPPF